MRESTRRSPAPRRAIDGDALAAPRAARRRRSTGEAKEASSPDKVAAAISERVLQRRYVPGQKLVEADLARDFAVGRGTIREALKQLTAQGVISLLPHRGAYVRSMSRKAALELLVVLERLTPLMARLAAENIEAGENRQRFRRAFAALLACRAAAHSDDFLEERRRFYQVVREIGGNAELSRVMPLTHIHLFRMQFHSFQSPAGLQAQFAEYERIGQAIQDGDAAAAERYMRTHIRRSRRRLDAVPEAAFFRSDD